MALTEYCSHKAITTDPQASVVSALERMQEEGVGCVVATEEGRPTGILTDRDAGLAVLTRKLDPRAVRVAELMQRPVQTVKVDTPLGMAFSLLRTNRLRRLPVVDDAGLLVGVLTLDDLLRLVATEIGDLAEAIRRQFSRPPHSIPARPERNA